MSGTAHWQAIPLLKAEIGPAVVKKSFSRSTASKLRKQQRERKEGRNSTDRPTATGNVRETLPRLTYSGESRRRQPLRGHVSRNLVERNMHLGVEKEDTRPFPGPTTQWCKFLSQEVRENRAFFVVPPREFPLSVCATFTREFQIITQNYTPLSKARKNKIK